MTSRPLRDLRSLVDLPEELLALIVEFAAVDPHSDAINKGCIKALSLTCKPLKRVSQPLLYRNIEFSACSTKNPAKHKRVMMLYRALYKNTHFGKQCRSLCISIPDFELGDDRDLSIAKEIVAYLPETQTLSFRVGYLHGAITADAMETTWDLLRHISLKCPAIQYLHLSKSARCLLVNHILKYVNFPRLKSLHIDAISPWPRVFPQLEPGKRQSAPITHLSISNYADGPDAISCLIQWPAALSIFCFQDSSQSTLENRIDCSDFQKMLLVHKDTLTRITLGYMSLQARANFPLFKASLFPNLEFLRLSRYMMRRPISFCGEDADILGPSLKTFCLDFDLVGWDNDRIDKMRDFGMREIMWLRQLARTAVARQSALEKIEIIFHVSHSALYSLGQGALFVWDGLDLIRDEDLRPSGRDLTYNEPPCTIEQWQLCDGKSESEIARILRRPEP